MVFMTRNNPIIFSDFKLNAHFANNMLRFEYIIITVFCFGETYAKLTVPRLNSTQNQIINCAIEISNSKFNLRKHTVVLSKDVEGTEVSTFLMAYKGTVVIETKKDGVPPSQVVVIVESFESFMKILHKLKPDLKGKTLLNSGARFLILLYNRKKMERITSILWSYHVTDAVIIVCDKKNRVALYTYYPYKNYLNCQNTEPVLITLWKEKSPIRIDLYPDKMRNMRKCPMYISTNNLYHPVTEKRIPLQIIKKTMIKLLRDILNFTPIISTRDYISIDSDRAKNWSDSLNDVIMGFANISTCTIPLGVDRLGLLDYSMPYFRVRLAWLAPPVVPGPPWWRLLSPLNGYLWLGLLIVTFIVKALPYSLKLRPVKRFCYRYFKNIDTLHSIGFRTWGVLVGQPIRVAPRRFRDFYIISMWMWFTFVVRSAYQSVLIGALKTDTLVGNFANLKDAVDEGYKFGGRAGIYAHFEFDPLIRNGFEIIPEAKFEKMFRDIIEGRNNFLLATSLEYAIANCLVKGKKENECGHVLPDSIMTVPIVVWMKMHSPYARPLSLWIQRFEESGLMDRKTTLKTSYDPDLSTDPSPLTSHQTLSCILCLLLGYAISFFVFVLEILTNKTKPNIVQKSCTNI